MLSKKFKSVLTILCTIIVLTCTPSLSYSAGVRMFQKQSTIAKRFPVSIYVVGQKKDFKNINRLFSVVLSNANRIFNQLDHLNPSSDIAHINTSAGRARVRVSPITILALKIGLKISKWTNGNFNISYLGRVNNHILDIDEASSTVGLKNTRTRIHLDGIMEGFLADMIIRYIYAANIKNAVVKVGYTFHAIGRSLSGPWRIQIEDKFGTFAHHAVEFTLQNGGAAATTIQQMGNMTAARCKGSVVIMSNAAEAEGVSHAAFILGANDGSRLISKLGRGMTVDMQGHFIRTRGF